MAWLITGGAGYIGAHVVREMIDSGREVVVLDDLSTGMASRVPDGVPLVVGEVGDRDAVRTALAEHDITGVLHLAARKQVGESVERPLHYWEQNIGGLRALLQEMVDFGICQFVYSSSAAVYGQPVLAVDQRITEATPCAPINPYGATKLAGEWMLEATARAHGWKALSLRYFNVAGAASPELGDPAALNLIPMVLEALEHGRRPLVFGDDYPTPDGTCIRDYIHVADLASAHVAAVKLIEAASMPITPALDPAVAMRTAGERLQAAAARAQGSSLRLPGRSVAREMANQGTAAAEAASQAAAKAIELMPGAPKAMAAQLGTFVAKVTGGDSGLRATHHMAVNLGTGQGYSVFAVLEALRESVGRPFPVEVVDRRPGDPPALVAAPDLAARLLGWRAQRGLTDMTDSAWAAWQARGH